MSGREAPGRRVMLAPPRTAARSAPSVRLVSTRAAGSRGRGAAAAGAGTSGEGEEAGRAASAPLDEIASTPSAPAAAKRRRTASAADPTPAAKRARSGEAASGLPLCQPRLNAKTGFRGVQLQKRDGKYRATLKINGQHFYCGTHEAAEAAARAYDAKARVQGMEERLLNFPHGKPRTEPLPEFERVRNAKTGFFGVFEEVYRGKVTGKFKASLSFKGRTTFCGYHADAEAAARAYDAKVRKLRFQNGRLNFPDEQPPPVAPAPVAERVFVRNAKTGFFGVSEAVSNGKKTRKFQAQLWFKGRHFSCGTHATAEAAARAYDAKARKLRMPASHLNFPDKQLPAAAAAKPALPPSPSPQAWSNTDSIL